MRMLAKKMGYALAGIIMACTMTAGNAWAREYYSSIELAQTPIQWGQGVPLTVTAVVYNDDQENYHPSAPSGTVTFFDPSNNNKVLATQQLVSDVSDGAGTAHATTQVVPPLGILYIEAKYEGDTFYLGSNSATNIHDDGNDMMINVVPSSTPTVAWTPPTSLPYGNNLGAALNATATDPQTIYPVSGSFTYTTSAGPVTASTVLPVGTYTVKHDIHAIQLESSW